MQNHYVPRLILKHFSNNQKTNYMNLKNENVEEKNIKKCFCKINYYPDELEELLCKKIEGPFGDLLNNTILKNNSFVLNNNQMEIIFKYIITQVLRITLNKDEFYDLLKNKFSYSGGVFNQLMSFMLNEIYQMDENKDNLFYDAYLKSLYIFIEKLTITNIKELYYYMPRFITDENVRMVLGHLIHPFLNSYLAFWDTKNIGKEFIINDKGYAINNNAEKTKHHKKHDNAIIYNEDYFLIPISATRAIVVLNKFYLLLDNKNPYYAKNFKHKEYTVSQYLGCGSANLIRCGKETSKGIKLTIIPISKSDLEFQNKLLLTQSNEYIAYKNKEKTIIL